MHKKIETFVLLKSAHILISSLQYFLSSFPTLEALMPSPAACPSPQLTVTLKRIEQAVRSGSDREEDPPVEGGGNGR